MVNIAKFFEMCGPALQDHQRRVADLAVKIGHQLALPIFQLEDIRAVAFIHDVGKTVLPTELMVPANQLSDEQRVIVMQHPQSGYDILVGSNLSETIKLSVLQHHERIDGTGYPRGLKGREIFPEAKIVAIADVIDNMTNRISSTNQLIIDDALSEITMNMGTYYDPLIVNACLRVFARQRQFRDAMGSTTAESNMPTFQPIRCRG